ncbi:MAG: hypothetical protein RL669_507, partial [Pseudomonadota bacterium]
MPARALAAPRLARPALAALLCACALTATAADKVRVGFVSTLSGPGAALGVDIRDGFNLALKQAGGKLGGLPVELIVADDQSNPEVARQAVERLIK